MSKPHEVYTRKIRSTPEFKAWQDAIGRCINASHRKYKDYGGRGISMCEDWMSSFGAFLAHIGPRYDKCLVLDRIDNNRGYEPGNVRWATHRESLLNRRRGSNRPKWLDAAKHLRNIGMAWEKIDASLGLYKDASRRAVARDREIEARHV